MSEAVLTWVPYITPLICGFIYALAALFSKRAFSYGFGVLRTLVLYNWIMALCFLPMAYLVTESPDWSYGSWPLLAGCLFFLGQLTTFGAIRVGDVSIQAPVMGTKMLFVALFSTFLSHDPVSLNWWIAAGLSMVGVFLLSTEKQLKRSRSTMLAVLMSLLSALSFALCDVVVQEYASSFGSTTFPLLMIAVVAILSLAMIPFFSARIRDAQRCAWPVFLTGGCLFGLQALLLYVVISFFGMATPVNILYSSRGIWSLLLVCFFGYCFANSEKQQLGGKVMIIRFLGAVLMAIAIIIVFID